MTSVVTKEERMTITYKVDGTEVKLTPKIVQDYLTNGVACSDQEYKLFTELCKVRKLNPFLKEAYLIKYSESQPAQIVVGKDAILKRAISHQQFDGREQGVIVKVNGEYIEKNGTFHGGDEKLVGGWARVYRKDIKYPTYITVNLDEVKQTKKDGTANSNWATKSATMVEKVALVRALRETFIEDLGGMIDQDEVWEAPQQRANNDEVIIQSDPVNEEAISLDDL